MIDEVEIVVEQTFTEVIVEVAEVGQKGDPGDSIISEDAPFDGNKYSRKDGTWVVADSSSVTDSIVDGVTTVAPSQNAVFDALALKENVVNKSTSIVADQASNTKYPGVKAVYDWVTSLGYITVSALTNYLQKNTPITGGTKTKITYDANGLITSASDATTADINDSTNKRYVTDSQLTVLGNTSGTNSGDNATNSQYSGLATSKQDTLTDVNFGAFENSLTAKTTPVDADMLTIVDTEDSNKAKKVTFTNVKSFLKTYFDTVYTNTSAVASQITTALSGYATQTWVTNQNYITASALSPYLTSAAAASTYQPIGSYLTNITGLMVTTALGYTPYDATNPSGYITSSALSSYLTSATASSTYQPILVSGTSIKTINSTSLLGSGDISVEPTITAGTSAQYWRGDKSWQTLDKSAVGLGSVENTALSTWAGSTNITTLGTVTTGTWSATAIGATKGGTGLTSYATGDLLYASAANTLSKLAVGTNGHVLTLAAGVPTWAAPSGGWGLTGNAGTVYGTNFIGTTDNTNLLFKTNNIARMGIANYVWMGNNTSGAYPLEIGTAYNTISLEATGALRSNVQLNYGGFQHWYSGNWSSFGTNSSGQTIIVNGTSAGGTVPVITFNNNYGSNGNCGIGGVPVTSAKLAVTSTTSGFLPPVMTTAQRNAISSPAAGLMIYDSTVNKVSVYNGSVWKYLQYE